jgi:hypothetical protein
MLIDEIAYSTFHEISPNIMEIIVHEGEEITGERVIETHKAVYEKFNAPYALLINRINTYSHTRDSLLRISEEKNVIAFAIIVYSKTSRITAKIHTLFQDNVRIFDSKPSAIKWLRNIMNEKIIEPDLPSKI